MASQVYGSVWRAEYGEFSERGQFRVGYVGSSIWLEVFPIGQLADLIAVLTAALPSAPGTLSTGTLLQARKLVGLPHNDVAIEPRSDLYPPELLRVYTEDLPDLISTLTLLQQSVPGLTPADWDGDDVRVTPSVTVPLYGDMIDSTGTIDSRAALQALIDNAPAGSTITFLRGSYKLGAALTISKPLTILGYGATLVQSSTGVAGLDITSSDVTVKGLRISGRQYAATVANENGIYAHGASSASYIRNLRIEDCTIDGWGSQGIYALFVDGFTFRANALFNLSYAGVMIACSQNGTVLDGSVSNVTQGSPAVNSYGVAVTRLTNSAGELTTYPRSRAVTVRGVVVDGVPNWEGIDTHGGDDIAFLDNVVRNTKVGIALVASANNAGTDVYAPVGCLVRGNRIYSTVTDGSRSAGMWVVGCATQKLTGMVIGNLIADHGTDTASAGNYWGGIYLEQTMGVSVVGNVLQRCAVAGIHINNDNTGMSLSDNTIEDVWSSVAAIAAAVYVRSTPNTVTITGTQITRGVKTATRVNNEGIRCNTSSTQHDVGGNQWSAAITPVVNATGLKVGFYGTAPSAKLAVTGAKGSNAALGSLLTQLAALGLITDSSTA